MMVECVSVPQLGERGRKVKLKGPGLKCSNPNPERFGLDEECTGVQ